MNPPTSALSNQFLSDKFEDRWTLFGNNGKEETVTNICSKLDKIDSMADIAGELDKRQTEIEAVVRQEHQATRL